MDETLLLQLNGLAESSRSIEIVALALSHPVVGYGAVAVFIAFLWRQLQPGWLVAVSVVAAVAASDALCFYVLKPLVERYRPCHELSGLYTPAGCGGPWSMPSNHAANAFAAATIVTFFFPRAGPFAFLFAVGVAVSRPVLGVHYPTDIIAGALVGTVLGIVIWLITWRWITPRR